MLAAAERADDYSDTALGCAVISTLANTCYALLQNKYPDDAPSLDECNKFIDFHCCEQLSGDPRFVEQPYLFYRIGRDRVYWDYSRHNGIMRAIARRLFSEPAKSARRLRMHFASKFEESIKRKIEKALAGVEHVKLNVYIKDRLGRETVWEIDTGFVYRNILFLVETKNWFKPEKYFLAIDQSLSNRLGNFESVLQKQDNNLGKYWQQVAQRWKSPVIGAICVVCTESVEFTASLNQEWWLKPSRVPRICLIDELINYLQVEDINDLQNHPKFIRFSAKHQE